MPKAPSKSREATGQQEDAYKDVAHGISYLSSNSMLGRYALVLSPEIYLELERLQPNVGLLELDRIAKLVNGRVYAAGAYGAGKAALVCAELSIWIWLWDWIFPWDIWSRRISITISELWKRRRCGSNSPRQSFYLNKKDRVS